MLAARIRALVSFAAAAAVALPARAEDAAAPRSDRWRVSLSTGWGGIVEVVDWYGDVLGGAAQQDRLQMGVRVDRDVGRGRFGLGYTLQRWRDVTQTDAADTTVHVLVADAGLRWLRTTWVDLYSGGGIGFATWTQTGTTAGTVGSGGSFAFQLRLLGIDAGWEHVRLWTELGFGFEGVLLAGASWRF